MKRSRFTEEQIIGILREQEAGVATAEVCRRHGVSSATFYKWKAKFGGLDVSEARRLKALEDENAREAPPSGPSIIMRVQGVDSRSASPTGAAVRRS